MHLYTIMQDPGHSWVYYAQSQKLSLAELKIAGTRLESECRNIGMIDIAGINYISFEVENKLTEKDLFVLSRLSFAFAIFEAVEMNNQKFLVPVAKKNYKYLESKIGSLLKYQGKTNELFTKLMINVALLSSDFDYKDKIQLLDPVAGKGTTLFEGAIYGFDVFGIEIESKLVQEAALFFKKYLETEKYKHAGTKRKLFGKDKTDVSYIHEFEYAKTKEEYKNEELRKKLAFVEGSSVETNRYFKKNRFHLIVGDLPYGVAHGNIAGKKSSSLARNPLELLKECLPDWYKVLKNGGVLLLAWNKFVMPKKDAVKMLVDNRFDVLTAAPYDEFEHRVDMAIKRDIIVAKK